MTHDIAKIDNYSVYRRLGNNLIYLGIGIIIRCNRSVLKQQLRGSRRPRSYIQCIQDSNRPLSQLVGHVPI